jgi:hypothetical protein
MRTTPYFTGLLNISWQPASLLQLRNNQPLAVTLFVLKSTLKKALSSFQGSFSISDGRLGLLPLEANFPKILKML